ncbi:hypothetical protein YH69_31495 [Pseudomonas aeruginosa]|nr:hypothetical protein YH69_31495 [Pseudomonas aeruginosa]KAF0593296.1 hypothetical protein PAPB9_03721 [Pseudomonas aeruginosa]
MVYFADLKILMPIKSLRRCSQRPKISHAAVKFFKSLICTLPESAYVFSEQISKGDIYDLFRILFEFFNKILI